MSKDLDLYSGVVLAAWFETMVANWSGRLVVALLALPVAAPAYADKVASPWQETDHSRLRLVSAQSAVGAAEHVQLGLEFRLEPGWKIYWRSPGDAGIPPHFDWSASANLAEASVDWPAPNRFRFFGLETFGYEDGVVLPVRARLAEAGRATRIHLRMRYAVCSNICVPHDEELTLNLPAGSPQSTAHAAKIARYAMKVPTRAPGKHFKIDRVSAEGAGRDQVLLISAIAERPFGLPDMLVEAPGRYVFGRPELTLSDDGKRADFRIHVDAGKSGKPLTGLPMTVTLIDGARAVERQVVASPKP
ncbi:MAG: hypothetical protein MI806_07000 [Minwuiales bacterium]|nr:hypothetical protein [Minwuiales bacterium]